MSSGSNAINKNKVNKRTYYYNYGTANPNQASSGYSSSCLLETQKSLELGSEVGSSQAALANLSMTRSCSVGSVISGNNSNLLGDFSSFNNNTSNSQTSPLKQQQHQANSSGSILNTSESLFDFGK